MVWFLLANSVSIFVDLLHILKVLTVDNLYGLYTCMIEDKKHKLKNFYIGKTVLITGASSGIGKALSIQLFNLGANIILSSRSKSSLDICADDCIAGQQTAMGNKIISIPLDLEKFQEMDNYFELLKAALLEKGIHSVDVLIHNAGVSSRGYALDTAIETLHSVMSINFYGPVALTKVLLPWLLARNTHTSIAVVSSVQGKLGIPLRTSYAASKHALQGYFDSLRAEVECRGVSVTVISPGYVNTALSVNALAPDGSKHGVVDATTAAGASPHKIAQEILLSVARGEREVTLADVKTTAAIQARALLPDFLAKIVKLKKKM